MKIRFKIDQADLFRRGIDAPKSIVSIEVNPAELSQDQRNTIAHHLDGIDVVYIPGGGTADTIVEGRKCSDLIVAKDPNLESLLKALHEFDARLHVVSENLRHHEAEQEQQRTKPNRSKSEAERLLDEMYGKRDSKSADSTAAQPKICGRCGQPTLEESVDEPRVNPVGVPDTKLCVGCNQLHPYPTRPGNWQYRSYSQSAWLSVKVIDRDGELHVIYGTDTVPLPKFGEGSDHWQKQ